MNSNLDISHGVEMCPIPYDDNSPSGASLQDSFKYVKTNIPGPGFNKEKFSEQFAGCDCNGDCTINVCSCLQLFGSAYDEAGKLKVDILGALSSKPVLECGRACLCDSKRCTNRIVQQGIEKSLYIFQTKGKGYGLMLDQNYASEISSLSFVCEYAGEVIGDAEARKRIKETDITKQANYLIALREHVCGTETYVYVDPRYIGNVGRFINHSCDPNLFMVPVRVNHQVPRLALFTRKNIKPGEELTFDYSGNATVHLSSGSVTKDKPSQACFRHSETSNSSDISSDRMQLDKLIQTSAQLKESESDISPPRKRMKNYPADCSLSTSIHNTENVSSDSAENNNESNKIEVEVTLQQSVYGDVKSKVTPIFETDNPKASFAAFVKRKPCICGSRSCTGFLPLDGELLCD